MKPDLAPVKASASSSGISSRSVAPAAFFTFTALIS